MRPHWPFLAFQAENYGRCATSWRLLGSLNQSKRSLAGFRWDFVRRKTNGARAAARHEPDTARHLDHRELGRIQALWTLNGSSPGSPIFTPEGTYVFQKIQAFLRAQNALYGFREVVTPTLYKRSLWENSGHWENYRNDMFVVKSGKTVMKPARTRLHSPDAIEHPDCDEGHFEDEFGLKPMNCPGHCLLFASSKRSYKDLPIRYSDFSPLHRDEISGALSGLTRVRRFHQDDGHIFCQLSQVEGEVRSSLQYMQLVYRTFGIDHMRLALSTRPKSDYIGTEQEWAGAEAQLQSVLEASGMTFTKSVGDGAFYGPKIDAIVEDATGKQHQLGTVQLDFQLPKRFGLKYVPGVDNNTAKRADSPRDMADGQTGSSSLPRPVLIHRAMIGSIERFLAILLENSQGRWPFWINPRPARVLTVTNEASVAEYAETVVAALSNGATLPGSATNLPSPKRLDDFHYVISLDTSGETVSKKVVRAKSEGYGIIVVIGKRNVEEGQLDVDLSNIPDQFRLRKLLNELSLSTAEIKKVKMRPQTLRDLMKELSARYL